jgi:hypothetical protein
MMHSSAELAALQAETGAGADLEAMLAQVELRLATMQASVRQRDVPAIADDADELHRALARAVEAFMHAARNGGIPPAMRLRLARASAQVARQREGLARATAALDRAIDVLIPGEQRAATYAAHGRMAGSGLSGLSGLSA